MLFNFGKCKCLHTGPGNTGMNYEMGGSNSVFCPGFQKSRVPSEKGTFSAVNGP